MLGQEGGLRDFQWRLTGPTVDPDRSYGATVLAYSDYSDFSLDPQYMELTLTPDGPLIDGTAGKTITSMGDLVEDVAAGRYTYSARYVDPGEPARDLEIRVRDTGDYAGDGNGRLEQISTTGQQLELQVRSIGGG